MSAQQAVIKFRESKVGTIPYGDNSTQKIEIPRVNAIRRLMLKFFITVVGGSTGPVEATDTILNIIKKIRLVLDGDENKFNIDGLTWYMVEKYQKGTNPKTNKDDDHAGGSVTKVWTVYLNADFAANRLNESDSSALLPAAKYAKLDLEVDWGDINDIYTTLNSAAITVASSGVTVEMKEAFLSGGDAKQNKAFAKGEVGSGFIDFRESQSSRAIDGAHTSFEDDFTEDEVHPVPSRVFAHLYEVFNGSDARSDSVVTDIKVIDIRGQGDNKITRSWDLLTAEAKSEYGLESLETGIAYVDWLDKLGTGLENFDTDDTLKIRLLSGAAGTFKKYTKYVVG